MDAHLLGRFTCDTSVTTVASLLYFDQVHTMTLFAPRAHSEEVDEAVARLRPLMGAGAQSVIELDHPPEGARSRDILWLLYAGQKGEASRLLDTFGVLIKAGVLTSAIYDNNLSGASELRATMLQNLRTMIGRVVRHTDALVTNVQLRDTIDHSDSFIYVIPELIKILDDINPRFLDSTHPKAFKHYRALAYVADLAITSLYCNALKRPIAYNRSHYGLLQRMIELKILHPDEIETPTKSDVAQRLTATTLRKIPVLYPRSLEALIELRNVLSDELADFRRSLDDVAEDLVYAKHGHITHRDIEYAVDSKIVRPVMRLEKRLQNPGREVLKHLATTGSFITQAVSFGVAMMSGLGAVGAPLLAASAGLLTASLQTKFDRAKDIRGSGLGFIIGVKARA